MTSKDKTPQNQREFIDYRFSETNDNIAAVQKTVEAVQLQLSNSYATKDYVDAKVKDATTRLDSLESDRVWAVRLIIGFVIMGVLYAVVQFKS